MTRVSTVKKSKIGYIFKIYIDLIEHDPLTQKKFVQKKKSKEKVGKIVKNWIFWSFFGNMTPLSSGVQKFYCLIL